MEVSVLLALDIGFRNMGWLVFNPFTDTVVDFGCIQTEKLSGKRSIRLRVSEDDFYRCQRTAMGLCAIISEHRVTGIVAEIPTGGARGARPNRTMGLATGLLAGLCEAVSIPTETYSPMEIKKAATGQRNASKEAVIEAMTKRFPAIASFDRPALMEHIADAAAVIIAAQDGILYRTVKRSMGEQARRKQFKGLYPSKEE